MESQHHWDLLVWLFKYTIMPSSVSTLMVMSKISLAVLPKRSGLALIRSFSMKLFFRNSYSENVRRTWFIPNLVRIYLHS